MLTTVYSSCIKGVQGHPVQVEVDVTNGLPTFALVGLPDAAVKESKDRVYSAIKNVGYPFPMQRITINLAPADIKKEGPIYDLPIALGLLQSCKLLVPTFDLKKHMFIGELSLSGNIGAVRGILPMVLCARDQGFSHIVVPRENASEASMVKGIKVLAMAHLSEVADYLLGSFHPIPVSDTGRILLNRQPDPSGDFADVQGHHQVKRGLEVAAAGFHNVLMIGPPGSGKTMLAKQFPTILPPLTMEEALEVTKLHSIAGALPLGTLMTQRPFRSPHHTITKSGLAGGGAVPRPGEITLAHLGVLFLDEMSEFNRACLEILRQPLEDKCIHLTRGNIQTTFPSFFLLIGSINPCPCGYFGDEIHPCTCTDRQRHQYRQKISGPLLDRMDIQMEVRSMDYEDMVQKKSVPDSSTIRKKVEVARQIQLDRFSKESYGYNALIPAGDIDRFCSASPSATHLLEIAFRRFKMSGRSYHRLLRMARTIADLDGSHRIEEGHMAQSLQYRRMDRELL
ncbi:YifB family Mg chelatase-like AAA ATPase [Alkalibacter rhizosphaerae]|uniref:YifB family Mg chelatase-like AAA ATPase n=1 Tax=Alkalibacter rhizosphaerae TaxID=2815577 RepID=A0A974XF73_9FIRM|nr:YifB family Mg chelatase-like AAA ATPase [Alkalibacter rhizosphaerae]QSX08713.1 YifB family Mg chelatase-like AAA ATPase [Alkalibacter rhizosphaerae]